ncbi:hypothetical protein BN134_3275 [Cronobacter dublinensis 1210]|uniref:Uncharacterized protein n=1 Tax=Cronobacter dublinensis 1210 TaxID=1208656 RepID=A0ABM9QAF2_9ENTR|nr:hypothetical protein BN134_3275 [Cronobacter dublinensis 1210]
MSNRTTANRHAAASGGVFFALTARFPRHALRCRAIKRL